MLPEIASHICSCFTRLCITRVMSSAVRNFFDVVVTKDWSDENVNNNNNNNNEKKKKKKKKEEEEEEEEEE